MKQNPINNVAVVLDASSSMDHLIREVERVTDQQIKDLAELSTQVEQETRISVYTFACHDKIKNLIFSQDVLRLGSISGHYQPRGNTALVDATVKAIEDLEKTATLYGDHSFLLYVLTDGEENDSRLNKAQHLSARLKGLPENWTVAAFVPNSAAKFKATQYGFAPGNVAIWDASSEAGMREAGRVIRDSTAGYMTARASGLKGTTGLFAMGADTLNHKTVSTLKELTGFRIETVRQPSVIKPFIESLGLPFIQGNYFFQLIKPEKVSDAKQILVRHKISGKVYGGPEARRLVGLPDTGEVRIKPQPNGEYDVFIQSSSLNRNLIAGHDLLIKV